MKRYIVTGFFFASLLHAQLLTVDESVEKTLQNYPDVKSFQLKVKQSHSAYKSAFADYLPQINVAAQYNVTQTYVFSQNGVFATVDDDGWNAGIFAKQKVWDFGQTGSKVDAKKIDERISELSLKELKALLTFKVKSLYALMLLQQEAIVVRKQDLAAKDAYYKQALALLKEGLKTEADASRLLSAYYIAKENLSIAQTTYEKAKATLELYMNEKIAPDTTLDSSFLEQELRESKEQLYKEVLSHNYTLAIEEKSVEKNILLHKATKASHYGSVDLVASYNHIDTLSAYDSKLAGVTLTIPLYSGGRVSAEEQKAALAANISQEQKRSQELELKDELNGLLFDIERYNTTIEAKKAQLESAQKTASVTEGRYKEGLATYIELLDATTVVLNAKLGLLEAYYLRSLAIERIDYLKGTNHE
jgi:outer membrane protein TolC